MQIGLGVTTGSISPIFSQGAIENTGVATNVAIQGNGFFVLGDGGERAYTRAGNFSFDTDGMLVTPDGHAVQGYTAIDPVTGDDHHHRPADQHHRPAGRAAPAVADDAVRHVTNLDARRAVGDDVHGLGADLRLARRVARRDHHLHEDRRRARGTTTITVPGDEVTGGTAGTPFAIATGTLGVRRRPAC